MFVYSQAIFCLTAAEHNTIFLVEPYFNGFANALASESWLNAQDISSVHHFNA
jgi:hypothetical protein